MAKAVEDVLRDRITQGHINAKNGEGKYLRRIEVTEAGHPMPDEDSVEGAKRICEITRKAGENDLDKLHLRWHDRPDDSFCQPV